MEEHRLPGHLSSPALWLRCVPGLGQPPLHPVNTAWKGEISGAEPISWATAVSANLLYCGFPSFHRGYYWHFPLIFKTEKESLETT